MVININSAADHDGRISEKGVHHEQPTGTGWAAADIVEKGWPGADWSVWDVPEPYLFWPFDENTGVSTANDVTGNGHDGTLDGPTTNTIPGVLGDTIYLFDGTNDRVDVTIPAGDVTPPFTLAAVITADTEDTQFCLSLADQSVASDQYRLGKEPKGGSGIAGARFGGFDGSTSHRATASTISDPDIGDSNLHLLVGTENAAQNDRTIYVDGVAEGTNTGDLSSITGANLDRITAGVTADSTPFGFWDGQIGYVAVWNSELSATDISELWEAIS